MEQLIKCVAVDDEAPALRIIEQYVSRMQGLQLLAQFRNPDKAAEWLRTNRTDVLLLDINMPQQTGINLLQSLSVKPATIFTTAYSDFAADAFDLDAVDYLRKPFSFERFSRAIDKAKDGLQLMNQQTAEQTHNSSIENDFITIKSGGAIIKLPLKDILYLEAFQEYIKIFTTGKRHVIYERMKNMEKLLPASQFMRVHRSYIIAIKQVTAITGNMLQIGEQEIPVSRDLKDEVLKRAF